MRKLIRAEYEKRLKAYRASRLTTEDEAGPTGFFGNWAWHVGTERDFQRELIKDGVDWEREQSTPPSAQPGSFAQLDTRKNLFGFWIL